MYSLCRGYRILQVTINHLNHQKGMSEATDVILTGCSGEQPFFNHPHFHLSFAAGGLAVYLHADFVSTLIASSAKYRAFPDAG